MAEEVELADVNRGIADVDAEALDSANGFDCFRVNCASGATMTGVVHYVLWGARYNGVNPMID